MFQEFLPATLFALVLVFVRTGAAMMLLPGISDSYVMTRVRLIFALATTIAITPSVEPMLPGEPTSVALLFALLAQELFVGLFLGGIAAIMMAALATAGTIMSHMAHLANAHVHSPLADQQASIIGAFLSVTATVLMFVTGLHEVLFMAIRDSYELFPPGELPPIGDFSRTITETFAKSFLLGAQLGAPFFAVGLLVYLLMGLLGRLMPQVQIFLVVLPLQVMGGLAILLVAFPAIMAWFLGSFEETIAPFVRSG
jgi:flagellar biosynthetic protein FliR